MNKLCYFVILNRKFSTEKIFIRNTLLPICSKCVHFIEHTNNYPYDPIPSDEKHGRCKKFGEMNLITGEIEYDFAKNCRSNTTKCGDFGLEYIEKFYYKK